MKKLVIAEKPSVAKDLAKVLGASQQKKTYYEGKQYIITWCYGHLLTLKMPEDYRKEWAQWSLEQLPMLPKKFGIKPLPKTRGQLKAIGQLAKRSDIQGAVIATDAGREGELVARWVLEYIHFNKPVERLWISSQTDRAILDGFRHLAPATQYDHLYESALTRAKADWVVGLNVTRALTVKYDDQLSAGRVQTPTLSFVGQRDQQIATFIPQKQWKINLRCGELTTDSGRVFHTKEEAEQWIQSQSTQGKVVDIQRKEKKEWAPLLYDLTSLQQEASRKYQFSAKKTLNLVQSLYEHHKIVSYPRTDSRYLPTDLKKQIFEHLEAVVSFDKERILPLLKRHQCIQTSVFNNQKVSDHYGLIPTEKVPNFEKLSTDELRIYRLIVNRFIQLFEDTHIVEKKTIRVDNGQQVIDFHQQRVKKAGWKKVEKVKQQRMEKGQSCELQYHLTESMTRPPEHLTEADLLSQMEKFHLGTPATRAEMIEKLLHGELMARQGNHLSITPKGKQLLELVNPELKTPKLTEKWELQLQKIERGTEKSQSFMSGIQKKTKQLVAEIKNSQQEYKDHSMTTKKCPECGANLKEKQTKNGVLYVCSNRDCHYTRRRDPKVSNHRCPQCHKKMYLMQGSAGAYFKCPNCQLTEKVENKKQSKKVSKREERQLMKKYGTKETMESPLAAALKAAMSEQE